MCSVETFKIPSEKLTVVIRDDSPMIFCGDSPTYRSVTINLTNDQRKELRLKKTGTSGEIEYFEQISKCFIEPNHTQDE